MFRAINWAFIQKVLDEIFWTRREFSNNFPAAQNLGGKSSCPPLPLNKNVNN